MTPDNPKYKTLMITRDRDMFQGSTELAIAYEATKRGHSVSFQKPENFYVNEGIAYGITRRPNAESINSFAAFGKYLGNEDFMTKENIPLDKFDIIFSRVAYKTPDEKRDFDNMCIYLSTVQSINPEIAMVNEPLGMMMAGAKIYESLTLKEYMPETHITKDPKRLAKIMKEASRDKISLIGKPIDGMGGSRVMEVPPQGYRGFNAFAEALVNPLESSASIPSIIQDKIDGVDRRILTIGDQIIGAYKRVPEEDELRANVHLGGIVEKYNLQEIDHILVEGIAPRIKESGLYFCGLDVMGPEKDGDMENTKILELNVRCPGSIESLESLVRYKEKERVRVEAAGKIVEFAEYLRESKRQ
tara:strand:- start:2031 stop:3107 length:1077 start_codon:yes stop_codon:yes gene_type:complete